jgi:DNA-binding MarR family transcriptional regulator
MNATSTDAAGRVWELMRAFVLDNERRREVSEALGMSFIRTKALRRVARSPLTMRELTEELMTDQPYTTLVIDDLERRGLVARSADPKDRRRKIVSITTSGAAAATRANAIMARPPAALAALSEADLTQLERLLRGVAD